MSPRAIMRLALMTGSTDLSRTVKSWNKNRNLIARNKTPLLRLTNCRFCSQSSLDTNMNLDRAREALAALEQLR